MNFLFAVQDAIGDSLSSLLHARDVIDWIDIWFTVGGVLVTLVALFYTYRQAQKAKTAAEAAREAAREVTEQVSANISLTDLAAISSGLRETQVALRGRRMESALLRIQALRSALFKLRAREGWNRDDRQQPIQQMVSSLAKIQGGLERAVSDDSLDIGIAETNITLSNFIATLDGWSEELTLAQDPNPDAT